ncbi:hypothetical protein HK099_007470 [Clydaea vesicula]|uniref:C-CAP/cofactor C-like domain-containing protein n=1 Tax=Clydaea vesicula TaxID=447962 RepID=A0AAD5U001_9FUNG|nr:hypothetical protein HK099_007470 [Clydaea vesicula]
MESIISASQTFFEEFQSEKLEIENLITELTSEEEILKVKQKLSVLEQKYNNSLIFLPKYDQNSYKKKLLELNVFLKEKLLLMKNKGLNTSFSTQKKFSFKTKPKEKKPAENSINQLLDNNDVEDIKEFVPPNSATTVSNLTRDIVVIGDTVREVEGKNNDDCYILNSTESIILIEKPTYTLHLKNLKSCLVVSKNFIKGSIFFEGCVNCSFILACHQVKYIYLFFLVIN